jgi:hypothetical protein
MENIIAILTSEDKDFIKRNLIELIVEQMKSDLRSWDEYILYPPDVQSLVADAMEQAQSEFEEYVKSFYLEKMKSDFLKMQGGE